MWLQFEESKIEQKALKLAARHPAADRYQELNKGFGFLNANAKIIHTGVETVVFGEHKKKRNVCAERVSLCKTVASKCKQKLLDLLLRAESRTFPLISPHFLVAL